MPLKAPGQALSPEARATDLPALVAAGWALACDGRDSLHKKLKFKDFPGAWGFMTQIALLAEQIDHHPEWSNVYNRVEITLTTHSCKGLSDLDLHMARQIDRISSLMGAQNAA
jgi:4a-hydroxytetrahydrobiopterin dehydratase